MESLFSLRIVRVPPGQAPEPVRRALLGQVLGLAGWGGVEPVVARRPGVTLPALHWRDGPLRRWAGDLRRRWRRRRGAVDELVYVVGSDALANVLRLTAPEAFTWWQERDPEFWLPKAIELPASCCERIVAAPTRAIEPDCLPALPYRLELNLATDAAARPRFAHQACGEHSIAGAHCPNCDKPLLLLLSLDTTDPRLELADFGVATLPLLCCWTCSWNSAVVQYRVHCDRVELLRYPRGGVTKDFPYVDYPIAFAGAAFDLVPARSSVGGADESRVPVTQIGGFPQLLDGPGSLQPCHVCGRAMVFLATVGDTMPDGSSLTGNAWVQMVFLLCPEDRVVAVMHEVD